MKHIIKILNHALFFGSIMFLFSTAFHSEKELVAYVLLTAGLGAIGYVARWRIKTLVWFVISHLVLAFSVFGMISVLPLVGWYCIIWILVVLSSAILRLFPQVKYLDAPNYFYVCAEVVIYLLLDVLGGQPMLRAISLAFMIVLFMLHLLYSNMERMEAFVKTRGIAMELEEAKMKRVNLRFSLIYTAILGVLLGIISLVRTGGLTANIWRVVKAFLRFLFDIIFPSKGEQQEYIEEEENGIMPQPMEQLQETQELSKFEQVIGQILEVLILLAVASIIVVGLIRLIRFISRNFNNRDERAEEEIRESLLKREYVVKRRTGGFFEQLEPTPAKRVRRMYKKRMKRFQKKKKITFQYMSPKEQIELLKEEGLTEETLQDVQLLYEKARYSTEDVTDGEVTRFRSVL